MRKPRRTRKLKPVIAQTTVHVHHSALDLWPFVADANRMDRSVGLSPAEFTRTPRPEGGETVIGVYRRLGFLYARWREFPFEWQRPKRYSVVREYDFGPITRFYGGIELNESSAGTAITVFGQFTPRYRLVRPWLTYRLAPQTMRRARQQYIAISDFLDGRSLDPFPMIGARTQDVFTDKVSACAVRLQESGASDEVLVHLRRMIEESGDEAVAGMRPLELARQWGTDPDLTVSTFLQATVNGLLEMRWEFLCPSCRGMKADAARLRDLEVTGYCAACNLPFAASVDEGIEARFYPTDAVRNLRIGTYCIGNPMNTPHRIAQTTLIPHEDRTWRLELAEGPYVVRSPQSRGITRIAVDDQHDVKDVLIEIDSETMTPSAVEVTSGESTFSFLNLLGVDTTIAIDDAHWSDTATTPSRMLLVKDFNTLFSGEALAPGVELAVTRAGILFSDLAGSTALYEQAGEALAFRMVSDHFHVMETAIRDAGGAIVKTIGDAVMGAFPDGDSALLAAINAQRAIAGFDTHGLFDPKHMLKIGVNVGAGYLVTLNDRLDYFGTAVNIAARAQREARGGEIVVTAQLLADARAVTANAPLNLEPFNIRLKGISEPVRLVRIRIHDEPTVLLNVHERETSEVRP
jgi:class 3 adenylate cyclase